MEKERVKKGNHYFWIDYYGNEFGVFMDTDWRMKCSNERYESGNYFLSSDDANKAVSKLRAVLKGADVIEMPSDEDMKQNIENISRSVQKSYGESDGVYDAPIGACLDSAVKVVEYLKSKIVK